MRKYYTHTRDIIFMKVVASKRSERAILILHDRNKVGIITRSSLSLCAQLANVLCMHHPCASSIIIIDAKFCVEEGEEKLSDIKGNLL